MMKQSMYALLVVFGAAACAHHEPVTERTVVERERQVPSREVVVEHRVEPNAYGDLTDERIVHERVVPRTQIRRTETTTTHE